MKKTKKQESTKSVDKSVSDAVIAKSDDGSIQITYTIPFDEIKKTRSKAVDELGKNIDVDGFRKGKAPKDVLMKHIPENTLLEKTLAGILPQLVGKTIKKEKLRLAIYPKFQLIKAKENESWEVRAKTAEIPEFELGDYKSAILGSLRAKKLWVPGKKQDPKSQQLSREAKEQEIIQALIESVKIKISQVLIEEDTNARLSKLLQRIEKLGLNLDSYLASLGKKPQDLRAEYEKQARETLALDLILSKIAEKEKIEVKKEEVDAAIKATSADKNLGKEFDSPEKRRLIESILKKRAALNHLVSLSS